MDRQKFVQIYNSVILNKITRKDAVYLYECYCKEFNKPVPDTKTFIQTILDFNLIHDTIQYPLDYYAAKFNVCTIQNKEGKLISIF